MSLALAALLAAVLLQAGCTPAEAPLPPQRPTYSGPERAPYGAYLRVADPNAAAAIVSGVRPEARWGWTARHAKLRFHIPDGRAYDFSANLYLAAETLPRTGPVAISFAIDGKPLGVLRAGEPREYTFTRPVPAGWLRAGATVEVAIETDRVWTAPDGAEYAFLLVAAGFLPR